MTVQRTVHFEWKIHMEILRYHAEKGHSGDAGRHGLAYHQDIVVASAQPATLKSRNPDSHQQSRSTHKAWLHLSGVDSH